MARFSLSSAKNNDNPPPPPPPPQKKKNNPIEGQKIYQHYCTQSGIKITTSLGNVVGATIFFLLNHNLYDRSSWGAQASPKGSANPLKSPGSYIGCRSFPKKLSQFCVRARTTYCVNVLWIRAIVFFCNFSNVLTSKLTQSSNNITTLEAVKIAAASFWNVPVHLSIVLRASTI